MNTNDYREKKLHGTMLVPYACYPSQMPQEMPIVPLHWHPELELDFVRSGSALYRIGTQEFSSEPGDIMLLPPNQLHSITVIPGKSEYHDAIVFRSLLLGDSLPDRAANELITPLCCGALIPGLRLSKNAAGYGPIAAAADDLFTAAKTGDGAGDVRVKADLMLIVAMMHGNGFIRKNETASDTPNADWIKPVLVYINDNYSQKISIEDLAKIANFSPNYFMHHFREATNMTAIEYIVHLRIRRACEMLRLTRESATYIALECGYRNISNFNRKFHEIVGRTPSQYRRDFFRG